MIKLNATPRCCRMTVFAGASLCASMDVINPMAPVTACRCDREIVIPMTVITRDGCMTSSQRIRSLVMVETNLTPVRYRVTTVALLAQSTIVDVLREMTPRTMAWRVTILFIGNMTIRTGRAYMGAAQYKICPTVIEQARINHNDVRISAFMICMAGNALVPL